MKRIFKWIVFGCSVLVGLTLLLFVALVILRLAGVIETDGPTTSDAVSVESTDLPTESVVSAPTAEQDTEVSGTGSTLREFLAATLTAAVATEPVPVQQLAPQQPEPPTATPELPTSMPAPPNSHASWVHSSVVPGSRQLLSSLSFHTP